MKTVSFNLQDQLHIDLCGVTTPFSISRVQDYIEQQYTKTYCGGMPARYYDITFDVQTFDAYVLALMTEAVQSNFDIEGKHDYILEARITDYDLKDNEFRPLVIELDIEDGHDLDIMRTRAILNDPTTFDKDAATVYVASHWKEQVIDQLPDVAGTSDPDPRADIDPRWVELYTTNDTCRDIKYWDAFNTHPWEWRDWCRNHNITPQPVCDLLDLVCWAIDKGVDYDEFMSGKKATTTQPQTTHTEAELGRGNTNNQTTNNTMSQTTTTPAGWKMAPATPDTNLEETYASKFEAAFAIVLDPESNTTLGDMPRSWSYRGGKNNLIVCTIDGIGELTYEVQFGKRTQYITHNDVKYVFASVPNMKHALEECFDEDGNATDAIWQYCTNKPKADTAKTNAPKAAPKANTKTAPVAAPQTTAPAAASVGATAPSAAAPQTPSVFNIYECAATPSYYYCIAGNEQMVSVAVIIKESGEVRSHTAPQLIAPVMDTITKNKMTEVTPIPPMVITALINKGVISAPMSAAAATPAEGEPSPTEAQAAAEKAEQERKAAAAKAAAEKAEQERKAAAEKAAAEKAAAEAKAAKEDNIVPLTLPDTIVASDLKDGRMTLTGLNDLTAEQVQIFIAGMNAMKEAIRKQMKMTGTDSNLPF